MKSLRIALPLVLVITQDMSAMSAMCGRLNQFSAYARQTAQRMMATNQSLSLAHCNNQKVAPSHNFNMVTHFNTLAH